MNKQTTVVHHIYHRDLPGTLRMHQSYVSKSNFEFLNELLENSTENFNIELFFRESATISFLRAGNAPRSTLTQNAACLRSKLPLPHQGTPHPAHLNTIFPYLPIFINISL